MQLYVSTRLIAPRAFYNLVWERCVTPSVLILELTFVLYKNNKILLKITCRLKLNLKYSKLHIYNNINNIN